MQLKGFKDEESLQSPPDNYSLVVREKNAENERILKYVDPTDVFKVDSDISSLNRKSLEKKTDPGDASKKFVQLYNFDNATQDLTGTFQPNGKLSDGIDVLVRYNNEIHYASLSV